MGLQTDDTLICGTERFLDMEQAKLCFPAKPRETLSPGKEIVFNGATINQDDQGHLKLTQQPLQAKIELVKDSPSLKDDYRRERAAAHA